MSPRQPTPYRAHSWPFMAQPARAPIVVGAAVRFRVAVEPGDEGQRFRVLELRGPRVLVQGITGFEEWPYKPTFVYAKADLEVAQ